MKTDNITNNKNKEKEEIKDNNDETIQQNSLNEKIKIKENINIQENSKNNEEENNKKELEKINKNELNKILEIPNQNKNEMTKKDEKIHNVNILKLVKSNHIIKKLFSNLCEIKKLEIIKYNKNIPKQLNINIEDYKKKSGKYKIGGINGKGKEFKLNKGTKVE